MLILLCAAIQIALWTASFVVMTLVINAPLLPWVMRKTGLAAIASVKRRMRAKAVRALVRFTSAAIEDLKDDHDEMLRGATATDWHSRAYLRRMLRQAVTPDVVLTLLKGGRQTKWCLRVCRWTVTAPDLCAMSMALIYRSCAACELACAVPCRCGLEDGDLVR